MKITGKHGFIYIILLVIIVFTAALVIYFIYLDRQINEFQENLAMRVNPTGAAAGRESNGGLQEDQNLQDTNGGDTSADETTSNGDGFEPEIIIRNAPTNDPNIYDTVISNVRLINPETLNDIYNMNIGIKNGAIEAITKRPLQGGLVIDGSGLVASPGFIDIDSYEISNIGARHKIADGVTTNLLMHGGTRNARSWYENYGANPPFVNYGASNFITQIRADLGYGGGSVMTNPDHIARLCERVAENLLNGALGISMSPEYTPGVQGEEMLALSRLAYEYDVATYYHLRYSTPFGENNSLVGIQEVISLARETGAGVHILHISSTGATFVADEAYAIVAAARAEGLDITADIYPYDSWATYLGSARFSGNWQERFGLTYSDLQLPNTPQTLTAETFQLYRGENRLAIANGSIPEAEVRLALIQPYVFIASDTIIFESLDNHPRGSGTFSRVIGKYARDENVITLMEAIAKLTIMPAMRLDSASDDIKRKGRLEIGADADIVLFDYNTIRDTATNEKVASYSEGIYYVFVNGQLGLDPGGVRDVRAGRPVMSRFASPAPITPSVPYTIYYDGENMGTSNAYELHGLNFVDIRHIASITNIPLDINENGLITFGQSELIIGETGFSAYGQESHLLYEPLIYKGSVYIPLGDLNNLHYLLNAG